MAGLIEDSQYAAEQGNRALGLASGLQQRQVLENYQINAQNEARNVQLGGEIVGTAIGAAFGQPGMGYAIGKKAGGTMGGIFSGTGNSDPLDQTQGQREETDAAGGRGMSRLYGSLLRQLKGGGDGGSTGHGAANTGTLDFGYSDGSSMAVQGSGQGLDMGGAPLPNLGAGAGQ